MATIEKLLVQIFDRKRQFIQQLNNHKQLYHQQLLSKLLINGISPPPFLLSSDFHPSSSDLTELNKEELISGLLLPRPGPLTSYPSGPCLFYDKPLEAVANSNIPDVTSDVKCFSSDGMNEDESVVAPPGHVCGSEDMAGIALLSHADVSNNDGIVETSNFVPMSPEDQADSRLLTVFKLEASLGRIQRSRSRQKALELRNSAKANGKSSLGIENDADISYMTNMCYDEPHDGLQKSLDLVEPLALPPDACGDFLALSKGSTDKKLRSGDSKMKKNSSACGGPFTRSRFSKSCSKQTIGSPSGSENVDVSSGSLKLKEPSRFSSKICSKEQAVIENPSDKERPIDAVGVSLTYSAAIEGKVVEMGGCQKNEECSKAYGGRITRSRSSCRQYTGESLPLYLKSNEVCIGQMTRSKSGKAQQAVNDDLQNGSISSYCNQPIDAFGYSMADNTNIRSDEAKEVGTGNEKSRSRKQVSVKPTQLDFEEVEERNLGGIPNCMSRTISLNEGDMLPDFNVSYAMDGSWPCYKRRKMEHQNLNKSASPTLRVNSFCVINDKAANKSSGGKKENIPSMSQNLANSYHLGEQFSSCGKEIDQSVSSSLSKEQVSTPLVQCGEDEVSSGRIVMSSTCEPQHVSEPDVSNVNHSIIAELSESMSGDGKETTYAPSADERVSYGLQKDQYLVDISTSMKLMDMAADKKQFSCRVDESKFSIGSPLMEHMDVAEAGQSVPELECFVVGENTAGNSTVELDTKDFSFFSNIIDRTSLPGKICNSATSSIPLSPFPSACKVYLAPGIYSSVPNGLLENIDLRSNLQPTGNALVGKSHSDIIPFPGSQCGWDMKKHFLSPVGNGFEVITSKSGDSDKPGSSNLELTCFPIMEDPESSEEVVNDTANTDVERTDSTMQCSANMEPHIDITMEDKSTLAPNNAIQREKSESESSDVKETDSSIRISDNKELLCDATLQHENSLVLDPSVTKYSLGSVSTISKIHSNVKKSGLDQRRSRQTGPGKENKGFSIGTNSRKKHEKAQSSRFSKPQLSAKSNLRSRGQSMSVNKQKHNNIVSNMKSFLPLVQQKQAAAVVPEKRDVKVKALQAAEAAKCAAEKRENERKQKKEAMKLERARMELEQVREMELKKKLKEEERKKKEAQNAAKKRQREEEERQEKERKKKRIEDARLQHKQVEEKLHALREELRCAPEDERPNQRKDCNDKAAKQVNRGHEGYDTRKIMNYSVAVGNDRREADDILTTVIDNNMSMETSAIGKEGNIEVTESSTPNFNKDKKTVNQINVQESYDISPYQCSDDEDEEEDEIPNKKFVPTWASRSNVALALSSLQHIDPEEIYPPGSFCSLDEVLLPRRLPQK